MKGIPVGIYVVVDEIGEGRGGENLLPLFGKVLRPGEHVDQHLLIGYGRLVEIDLPVHQPSGGQVVLQRVDALMLDDQPVVHHIEHLDDTCRPDITLGDPSKERVAPEIVETVHVEL